MNKLSIKSIKEEKIQISENDFQKQVSIDFDFAQNTEKTNGTITLSGNGSLKVPVSV